MQDLPALLRSVNRNRITAGNPYRYNRLGDCKALCPIGKKTNPPARFLKLGLLLLLFLHPTRPWTRVRQDSQHTINQAHSAGDAFRE